MGLNREALGLTSTWHLTDLPDEAEWCLGDPVSAISRFESKYYLSNTLLRDGDIFGMANSVEIRVPFLDRDLVEWVLQIPGNALLPVGQPPKSLLRSMCRDYYSARQLTAMKRGFTPPFRSWLNGPLKGLLEECLHGLTQSGLLLAPSLDHARAIFSKQPATASWSRIWALLALGNWLKRLER